MLFLFPLSTKPPPPCPPPPPPPPPPLPSSLLFPGPDCAPLTSDCLLAQGQPYKTMHASYWSYVCGVSKPQTKTPVPKSPFPIWPIVRSTASIARLNRAFLAILLSTLAG